MTLTAPQYLYSEGGESRVQIFLAASESGSLQDRKELQLSSFWGLALIIQPSILLSFWREDERFRLSPLVSEALLSLSSLFFYSSAALTLVILHPVTQSRKRSCDDYFTRMMIFIFVGTPSTPPLSYQVLQITEDTAPQHWYNDAFWRIINRLPEKPWKKEKVLPG